jgi:hypothetical protein
LISFEGDSRLKQIQSSSFADCSVKPIKIPQNVTILNSSCFSSCTSLFSVTFESDSQLKRIEVNTFSGVWFNHRRSLILLNLWIRRPSQPQVTEGLHRLSISRARPWSPLDSTRFF